MTSTEGKPIKCKAAVLWGPKEPLKIEEIEVAPPGEGEVRIKIHATGVCHSDVFIVDGVISDISPVRFPTILGHEGAGVVESVGKGVTKFQVGDHVIPVWQQQCGDCRLCLDPKKNSCLKNEVTFAQCVMPDGTTRFTCKGQPVYHFMRTSTFSQYTVVLDIGLTKINAEAPLDKVCLLGCGIPTGFGAAVNTAGVVPGSTCAVWGLGCIGLAAVMGCKSQGAKRIIGIDLNPAKFDIAKKFGVTECLNPKDLKRPLSEELIEMTDGGCDFTIECVGAVVAMEQAFESCRIGGGVCVIMGLAPGGATLAVKPSDLLMGKELKGSCIGDFKPVEDVPKLVEKYMAGKLMVDEFVTFTIPLDEINSAVDFMHKGLAIRTVIDVMQLKDEQKDAE